MELTEPLDIYAYQLGAVWGRLSELETLLRLAVSGGKFKLPVGVGVGDEVDTDALNRWGYMSELIPQYNLLVAASHPECVVVGGEEILQLRNALAHGIAARMGRDGDPEPASGAAPLRLLKFGKQNPATGKTVVEFAENMTTEWFDRQRRRIQEAIQTVASYITAPGVSRSTE